MKHLPETQWPAADRQAFEAAFRAGDLFDETGGAGAHLAEGSRTCIKTGYRRWLGFLRAAHPDDLLRPPADRISLERVRDFVVRLNTETRPSSVALTIQSLCYAARLIAGERDWRWLLAIKARLVARARPIDRFDRLVPPCQTLAFGIELMDEALALPMTSNKTRELQYRDGLFLALLSLWPIRRRSLAALTVNRHIEIEDNDINLLLDPADTKTKRPESFRAPEPLVPYVKQYLKDIRSMIERVELRARTEGKGLDATLHGDLAAILAACAGAKMKDAPDLAIAERQLSLVAGAGFEPATFRL